MAEDAELQAQMTAELHEVGDRLNALACTIQQTGFTAQEAAEGMYAITPILARVFQEAVGSEALWQARIDGPVYRQTPILGRFRWYRQLRVWLLRRRLR